MANKAYVHVTGANELSAALRSIAADVRAMVLEEGVKAAAQPVLVAAKRYAKRSERTGALRESLVVKTKNYPANGKAVAMVGPDKNYYRNGKRLKAGIGGALTRAFLGADRPANYIHLVEFGHHVAVGGSLKASYNKELVETGKVSKNGKPLKRWKRTTVRAAAKGKVAGWVPAKPILRPALLTTQSEQAAGFFRGIERGFAKAVKKVAKAA